MFGFCPQSKKPIMQPLCLPPFAKYVKDGAPSVLLVHTRSKALTFLSERIVKVRENEDC